MKKLYAVIMFVLFSSPSMAAAPPVSYIFVSGDPIIAAEVNANFQELADRIYSQQIQIDSLQTQVDELKDQSIGANEIWHAWVPGCSQPKGCNSYTVTEDGFVLKEIFLSIESTACDLYINDTLRFKDFPRPLVLTGWLLNQGDVISVYCNDFSQAAYSITGYK